MKKYKLKSREFVTQFWGKLRIDVTEDYFIENEFKTFTYTTEEIIKTEYGFPCIFSESLNIGRWIIPIDCLEEVYTLKLKIL